MKTCNKCRKTLPVGEFYKRRSDGTPLSHCKECNKKKARTHNKLYIWIEPPAVALIDKAIQHWSSK